jgi:hypothetical protein
VDAVAFSADGERAVTAGTDKSARLWDAATGNLIATLQGHSGAVKKVIFSPDGKRLVTASDDGTARLWDVETSKTIAVLSGHDGAVTTAMFSGSGDALVTGSIDNTARVWRMFPHTQATVDFAKETASRCLTPEERKQFFLAVEPPRWCITGPSREQATDIATWNGKPPYRTQEWTQWLAATDAARAKGQSAPRVPLPTGTIDLLRPRARPNPFFDR